MMGRPSQYILLYRGLRPYFSFEALNVYFLIKQVFLRNIIKSWTLSRLKLCCLCAIYNPESILSLLTQFY